MRKSVWLAVSMALAAAAACSPQKSATPAAPPAAAAAPVEPAAAAPEIVPPTAPAEPAAAPAPPPEAVHFSPADYGARERRIGALINNAESRDTLGETPRIAAQGRAERQRCSTKACIEHSYAAEEAKLRKWEGSGDIK